MAMYTTVMSAGFKIFIFLNLFTFLLCNAAPSERATSDVDTFPRLPTYLYSRADETLVYITPNFEEKTFEGLVIYVMVPDLYRVSAEGLTDLVVHKEDLEITHCQTLMLPSGTQLRDALKYARSRDSGPIGSCQSVAYDENTHQLSIDVGGELISLGRYHLTLEFKGKIRDDMTGFYYSTYYDENNQQRTVLATQFQPTHARKAFPCLDEPLYKSNFSIYIAIPPGYPEYHALSNMPVQEVYDLEGGAREFVFYRTPSMSTYLVAWVISDFEHQSDSLDDGSNAAIRTWARPNALGSADYSVQLTRKLLEAFEEYTSIPYIYEFAWPRPFDKIDQVAIPDFSAGAMENWGLITYRETALLFNDGPESARRRIAVVITHELAHMWFGNLVTTAWWNTTWLNEGFAEYFEYLILEHVHPEWRMLDQFVVDDMLRALELDEWDDSQPLTHAVHSPADASAAFRSLTYVKGASVLRMFSSMIGEDNFRTALRKYLQANAFKAVEPEHLFRELKMYAAEAGLSYPEMDELLYSWTTQNGYPYITVERSYIDDTATIKQLRYHVRPLKFDDPPHWVPLTWTQRASGFYLRRPQLYLTLDEPSKTIGGMPGNDTWVIFNVQRTGFYRVMYDFTNWDLIINYLRSEANPLDGIHVLNRAQLVDDILSFGRCGRLSYELVVRLMDYLPRETDYVPWVAAFNGFSYLDRMLIHEEKYPFFQKYVLNLIQKLYNRFEFKTQESHLDNLLMNRVSSWACAMDHPHCVSAAITLLEEYLNEELTIPANLRSVVYCHGIRKTGDQNWDLLWQQYQETRDETEKTLIVAGLACSNSEDRLKQLLAHSLDGDTIRKQDAATVFSSVYSNSRGWEVALEFLSDNFERIITYFGSVQSIVNGIADRVTTEAQNEQLENFIAMHREELGSTANSASLTALFNIAWLDTSGSELLKTLEDKSLYRLPSSVLPEQYNLRLSPDLETDRFQGDVTITVSVQESTNTIFLHAQDLSDLYVHVFRLGESRRDIRANTAINITQSDGKMYSSREDSILNYFEELPDFHLIRLQLREPLEPGQMYVIDIKYSGPLRGDMVGFYKTYYGDDRGYPQYLVATKFAPVHARKAFPCFDEPSFKARFKISIVIPTALIQQGYDCLANSEEESRIVSDDGSSTEVVFENSLKMSTYIVAWIVSDLQSVTDAESTSLRITTWARRNALSWAQYSLTVTRRMVQKLEDYTGYPYVDEDDDHPLRKLDQVGTPDFVSGAMENWGLITYRETALLYNDGTGAALKRASTVIAHELAHMWFGNLITCAWWEATWLNEGFATYFQFLVTQHVENSWSLMDQFVVDQLQSALALDAERTSKPLTHAVVTPAEAIASFGSLTYSKGASFLWMLGFVIGETNLENALKSYVENNAYKAATPDDLFEELLPYGGAVGLTSDEMLAFLRSWTEDPGFPLLHVTRHYDGDGRVTLTQSRFLADGGDITSQLYYIPLSWVESNGIFDNPIVRGFLTNREKYKDLLDIREDGWLIFNTQHKGYFRVLYDDENWRRITAALQQRFDVIHWLNRAQLLDDAFALARSGHMTYQQLLALTDYLDEENEYVPWAAALSGFAALDRLLTPHTLYPRFQEYVRNLLSAPYNAYGFIQRNDHTERLLMAAATARACAMGHEGCRAEAVRQLKAHLDVGTTIDSDSRSTVYCHGVRHAEDSYWDLLWIRFRQEHDEAERALLLTGLGCSANPDKLRQLLDYTLNEEGVRKQEATSAFAAVYATKEGADVTLEFLHEKYDEIRRYLGSVTSIVTAVASRLITQSQRNSLEELIKNRWEEGLEGISTTALNSVDRNFRWINDHANTLMQLIDEKLPDVLTTTNEPSSTTEVPSRTADSISTVTSTKEPSPTADSISTVTSTKEPSPTADSISTVASTEEPGPTADSISTVTSTEEPSSTTDSSSIAEVAFSLLLLTVGILLI